GGAGTTEGDAGMPHCFIMDFDGATAAQYDAVMHDMDLGGRLPAHALFHGAGSPDGANWRVVDVWETPQDFERFAAGGIGPVPARQGVGEPRITAFPIEELERSDSARPTFMHVVRMPGMDAAGFDELNRAIEPPAGLLAHGAGPLGDGWAAIG